MSGALLDRESIVRGLMAAGVPREKAEAQAARETAGVGAVDVNIVQRTTLSSDALAQWSREQAERALALVALAPITLRIPWSCLVSDNRKYGVVKGKLIAQKPYRDAKARIHRLALDTMAGRAPFDGPTRLVAHVWMPNNHPHDLTNSCKLVHDALEKAIYRNDSQLHDVRWIRAGVDVDAPRCELTITPL